jgi:hypothetical protein
MPKLAEFSTDYNNRKLLTDVDVNKCNMAKFIARVEIKQELDRLLQEMSPIQLN